MDVQTIDESYRQLQGQAQQTEQALAVLGQKLQNAAQAGDPNAREYQLDLREIALGIRQEQNQVGLLLQAIHAFVANQAQQNAFAQPAYPPQPAPVQRPVAYEQPAYAPAPQQGGGAVRDFLTSGFGQAIVRGAGFGIGDDLINRLFR